SRTEDMAWRRIRNTVFNAPLALSQPGSQPSESPGLHAVVDRSFYEESRWALRMHNSSYDLVRFAKLHPTEPKSLAADYRNKAAFAALKWLGLIAVTFDPEIELQEIKLGLAATMSQKLRSGPYSTVQTDAASTSNVAFHWQGNRLPRQTIAL